MNNLKQNPVGIDIEINVIQSKLYNKLGYSGFDGYGRIYLNEKKPMAFVEGNDYKELLTDDNLSGHFFFMEDSKTKSESLLETEIDIIFLLDLKKVKPNIIHRADEEVRVEILKVLDVCPLFHLEDITKGVDALKGFEHGLLDMQPYHFIKFTGNLKYDVKHSFS